MSKEQESNIPKRIELLLRLIKLEAIKLANAINGENYDKSIDREIRSLYNKVL